MFHLDAYIYIQPQYVFFHVRQPYIHTQKNPYIQVYNSHSYVFSNHLQHVYGICLYL